MSFTDNSPPLLKLSEFSLSAMLGAEDFEKHQDLLLYDTLPELAIALASEQHIRVTIEKSSKTDPTDTVITTIEDDTTESRSAE